jgi:hypothetical protein
MTTTALKAHDAYAHLISQADILPAPYLLTGPHAAYFYHRWLSPISKMIELSVSKDNLADWQQILAPPWVALREPPTYTQLRQATRMAILRPNINQQLWARRIKHQGLPFISPEDLALELLQEAKTSLGWSEIAALLIKQRDTFDWSYLLNKMGPSWLSHRLREIVHSINQVAGHSLIQTPLLESAVTSLAQKPPSFYLDDSLAGMLQP